MKTIKEITSNRKAVNVLFAIWLLFVVGFITKKGVVDGWNNRASDFNNYYVSSVLVAEGESIHKFYDNDWFTAKAKEIGVEEGAKFAPFPPITAFLYSPLSGFEFLTAKRSWLVFNALLLLLLPIRLKRIFDLSLQESVFITSLFFIPLAANLNFGQSYLFLSFLMVEAIGLVQLKSKRSLAAIILAFCALLKYFPILFILYLFDPLKAVGNGFKTYLFKQKWLLVFGGAIIGILLLSILLFHDAYQAYFLTFSDHLQGDLSGQGKHAVGFQSIDSLLNNLFVSEVNHMSRRPILKVVFKALFFGLIGWNCFKIWRHDKYRFTAVGASIMIIGAFILIPASASYHFLFLLIPVVFIFKWLLTFERRFLMFIFVGLLLMVFCIQHHHILEITRFPKINYIIHYPRLWSLLLLFGYLSYLKLGSKHG